MAISQPFNAPNYIRASEATVDDVSDIQRIINAIEMRDFKSLILHYQPQYHSKTLNLVGFEALARFKHVAGNITEPKSFIPALSDTNLLTDFDTAVMLAVLRSISVFQKIYGDKTTLSINVSQNSVCMPEFRSRLFKAIKKHQISPQCIFLEITETERLITSISQLTLSIEELVNHGVRVSLDDFGTGYSTIEQLALLPISEIKIDQQFIQSTNTEKGKEIVNAISSLGRSVADRIVVEGIENQDQHEYFANHRHVFILQGYLYSKPKDFSKLIVGNSIHRIGALTPEEP